MRGFLAADRPAEIVFDLEAGEFFLFEIDQGEIDVRVEMLDPGGRREFVLDTEVSREAPERVCFVAASSGPHTVRLASFGRDPGEYALRQIHRRQAIGSDHSCHEAFRRFAVAEERRRSEASSEELAAEYEAVHRLWKQAGEGYLAGLALREAGSMWRPLDRSLVAEERFQQALVLAREARSDYLETSLLNRLGLARFDRGDLAAAEDAFLQALDRARRGDLLRSQASALNNLGLVEGARGELHRAIGRYREALGFWRQVGSEVDLVKTLRNLADAYSLLDHHREALHLLDEALAIARASGDPKLEVAPLLSVGWVHHLRGRPEDAVPLLRETSELCRRLGDIDGEVAALDRLGSALAAAGDGDGALAKYRESLALSELGDSSWDVAGTRINLGCLFQELGRNQEALRELKTARRLFGELDDPKAVAHLEYCAARAERQRGDLDAALERVAAALGHVDHLRAVARVRGERYRPIWLWQDYSELEIELLMEKHRTSGEDVFARRAFEASDLARARNFLELILESGARDEFVAEGTFLEQERQLQNELNAAQRERRELGPDRNSTGEDWALLERRIGELSLLLERVRAAIRASGKGRRLAPEPVGLEELQRLLDSSTMLLSYVLGEERSHLFTVGHESFETWELAPRPRLSSQAEALYKALRSSRFRSFQHPLVAEKLAELLIPEGSIPEGKDRLFVLAADLLHYVPFTLLPSPRPAPEGERRLLGDDFEILYLPSASILAALRRRNAGRPEASKTVAVYADAVFAAEDRRLSERPPPDAPEDASSTRSISVERLPAGPLPRLPFTREEAEAILSLVPESERLAALGFSASKQAVLDERLDLYRILHFATHAVIDESFPELSGLVLSRRNENGQQIDGDLHLHEIYSLRLASDLVVLSGCQTALGQRVRGDGLISMTRGFLYAGSSQVLVSLWSVDDEATSLLMSEFYRGFLERGESPASALRSAQKWMRGQERWSAPYYWGAFVLQGGG